MPCLHERNITPHTSFSQVMAVLRDQEELTLSIRLEVRSTTPCLAPGGPLAHSSPNLHFSARPKIPPKSPKIKM